MERPGPELLVVEPSELRDRLPAVVDLYRRVYSEPPYGEGAEDADLFADRICVHFAEPRFRAAIAVRDTAVVACAYGFSVVRGSRWWDPELPRTQSPAGPTVPAELAYVAELMVSKEFRRQGLGQAVMQAFLRTRPEPAAALYAHPDAFAAQQAYQRWGWTRIGYGYPMDDGVRYDCLLIERAANQSEPNFWV